ANDPSRAPLGRRTVTVSTHVPMEELLALPEPQRAKRIAEIQDRMRETIASRAPEWSDRIVSSLPASPRTFERFTRRPDGFVGGIPRRAGLRQYLQLTQRSIAPGLHLVGDSIFPGQSTLATALGGVKVAERIASRR
ncbi:MAG: FAD-dependent oxidoreductase, partial [Planctomycetota bacterium]